MMQVISVWGPLIYAGCFAATLSTALTNLLSVPRLIQALGIDKIYPGLIFFSKAYGKSGEPYRGYVLTFFISVAFVLIGKSHISVCILSYVSMLLASTERMCAFRFTWEHSYCGVSTKCPIYLGTGHDSMLQKHLAKYQEMN
jgi:solute carrier family 12 sodium/potassium/chloride transporter 2